MRICIILLIGLSLPCQGKLYEADYQNVWASIHEEETEVRMGDDTHSAPSDHSEEDFAWIYRCGECIDNSANSL